MKLQDSLFTILSEKASELGHDYEIKLNPEHFIYAAHFPGEPITPGVCIMQIAHELLEKATGTALAVKCVKNVKFLKVISPDEVTVITYSLQKISREEDTVKAQVSVSAGDGLYAKLSLVCRNLA